MLHDVDMIDDQFSKGEWENYNDLHVGDDTRNFSSKSLHLPSRTLHPNFHDFSMFFVMWTTFVFEKIFSNFLVHFFKNVLTWADFQSKIFFKNYFDIDWGPGVQVYKKLFFQKKNQKIFFQKTFFPDFGVKSRQKSIFKV